MIGANAGEVIAFLMGKYGYIAAPLSLERVLSRAEVGARFTNLFVSDHVARKECSLAID